MITYCSNIHPAESWVDTFSNLRTYIPTVKSAVSPSSLFPIGLRLSNQAAMEIDSAASDLFVNWMQQNQTFIPSINGFPFGKFHSTKIKERVYLPDWRSEERVNYTKKLADLLYNWLPEGVTGSISTVPIGFKNCIGYSDLSLIRGNLISVLKHFDRLRQTSGKTVILALEPEPGCFLETTDQLISFLDSIKIDTELRQMLGICFDCCHHAIGFESPLESFSKLADAQIPIGKIQISSAPSILNPSNQFLESLIEPTYLHQVAVRDVKGGILRYNDISEALDNHLKSGDEEWRIHFHIPVFIDNFGFCKTTQHFIQETLPLLDSSTLLEIETYTWGVLPVEMRGESVTDCIIREIKWLEEQVK